MFNFSSISSPINLVYTAFGSISALDDNALFASAYLKQEEQQDGFAVY